MLFIGGALMILLFAFSAASAILTIGKEREPTGPGLALFVVVADLISIGIVYSLMLAAHV